MADTRRMLDEVRQLIADNRSAEALQLSDATRQAAQQLAGIAARQLTVLEALPAHTGETWTAAANLVAALERVDAVIHAPEAWAGMQVLFEAQHLLGAAVAQAAGADRLTKQRRKGGSVTNPESKAEKIRQAIAARPGASSAAIASKLNFGSELNFDPRHVRRVRAKR
jgi:hypothetical protein